MNARRHAPDPAWAEGMTAAQVESGGAMRLHVFAPTDMGNLLGAVMLGDVDAIRLMRGVANTISRIERAPRRKPMLCGSCPAPLKSPSFCVGLAVPECDELTSAGANQTEPTKIRLPPPELPLLTKHDRFSLAHEIERHVEFTVEIESEGLRPVALPSTFVDHFIAYRDSQLPRVGAIVTAPLVMADGALLATQSLDRQRKLVFRIEPRLMALMPDPRKCTKQAAAEALDFLASKWLSMHPLVTAFMAVWFGGVVFTGGATLVMFLLALSYARSRALPGKWLGILVPTVLLFGVGLLRFGRYLARDEQQFLLAFVRDTLGASLL